MKISAPTQKPISFFKRNDRNEEFFEERGIDLTSMIEDIRKRGVQVPLVAKEDGTLLAGHCRLRASIAAGIGSIPVRIVSDMTDEEELEYLLKDNTIRRHFGQAERLKIYRRVYPNFDKDVLKNRVISLEKIVSVSGLNYNTVNGDITRFRKMATDVRKRRTPEENLLIMLRRITTQVRNKIISGDIGSKEVKEIVGPLLNDMVSKVASDHKTSSKRLI